MAVQWLLMYGVPVTQPLRLERMQPAGELAYVVQLDQISRYLSAPSDDTDAPQRSRGLVLEDGAPLGPAHSLHDGIRQQGRGQFSHWQNWLLFSASDGSDPRQNSRTYVFEARYFLVEPYRTAASVAIAALASLVAVLAIVASKKPVWNAIRIVLKRPTALERVIRGGAAIALVLSALGFYGCFSGVPITVSIEPNSIQPYGGRAYAAPVEPPLWFLWTPHDSLVAPVQSNMVLLENGIVVAPAHAQHVLIQKSGAGAFSDWGGQLVFSTTDNSDPRQNGRIYSTRASWYLIEPFDRGVLAVISILAVIALWLSLLAFGRSGGRPWVVATIIAAGVATAWLSGPTSGAIFLILIGAGFASAALGVIWLLSGLVSRSARQAFERVLPNAALGAASVTLGLALLEATLGISMSLLDNSQDVMSQASPEVRRRVLARRGHGTLPDEWKMHQVEVAGADRAYYWHGALHIYDKNGMRFQATILAKDPKVFRIMVVGDSLTYGVGVDRRWIYSTILEQKLKKDYHVEIINLGVPGYQSEDVGATLQKYYDAVSPDLVIYGICLNDFLESGEGVYTKTMFEMPPYLKERSRLMEAVEYMVGAASRRVGLDRDFYDDILKNISGYQVRFAQDLKRMNEFVSNKSGKPIVAMVLEPTPEYGGRRYRLAQLAEHAANEAGMIVVRTETYFKEFNGAVFKVSRWEPHPNEFAHELYATMLYERVKGCCGMEDFRDHGTSEERPLGNDMVRDTVQPASSSH
jgi:hypothetical protein